MNNKTNKEQDKMDERFETVHENYFWRVRRDTKYDHNIVSVNGGRIAFASFALALALALLLGSFYSVGAGERAVEFSQGSGVKEMNIGEGLQFKIPLWESRTVYDVKQKKYEAETVGASKDSQDVMLTFVVRYHLDPAWVWWMHQNIGPDYEPIVVRPTSIEAVKKGTAQFRVEEILPNRTEVERFAFSFLEPELAKSHMLLDGIELVEIDFSEPVRKILEEKEVAKHEAIRQQNLLVAREAEASQKIALARGEAEAARIISQELATTPQYIDYLFMQRWNGELPTVMGQGTGLILGPEVLRAGTVRG